MWEEEKDWDQLPTVSRRLTGHIVYKDRKTGNWVAWNVETWQWDVIAGDFQTIIEYI